MLFVIFIVCGLTFTLCAVYGCHLLTQKFNLNSTETLLSFISKVWSVLIYIFLGSGMLNLFTALVIWLIDDGPLYPYEFLLIALACFITSWLITLIKAFNMWCISMLSK